VRAISFNTLNASDSTLRRQRCAFFIGSEDAGREKQKNDHLQLDQ
jgi:hypothetical protein